MFRNLFFSTAIAHMSMCQSGSQETQTPTPSGFSCADYQLMIDVELSVLQSCSTSEECVQPLDGFGCGCDSDTPLLNVTADSSYIYEMRDEAEGYGCNIEISTQCVCSETAVPTCSAGVCSWSE